ncbi:MAG: DUF192 domain-containing protein [Elusimicrobia bacterium]|nr:DUF192 domain-containing protein [Elusimicrobiota bacterium]
MIAFNVSRNAVLASQVSKADTPRARSRGLLGRRSLGSSEGMWIIPCPMIHTFFMKFPIDAVFLDSDLGVVRVLENLKPWRLSPWVFRAKSVLELPAGAASGAVAKGETLEFRQ